MLAHGVIRRGLRQRFPVSQATRRRGRWRGGRPARGRPLRLGIVALGYGSWPRQSRPQPPDLLPPDRCHPRLRRRPPSHAVHEFVEIGWTGGGDCPGVRRQRHSPPRQGSGSPRRSSATRPRRNGSPRDVGHVPVGAGDLPEADPQRPAPVGRVAETAAAGSRARPGGPGPARYLADASPPERGPTPARITNAEQPAHRRPAVPSRSPRVGPSRPAPDRWRARRPCRPGSRMVLSVGAVAIASSSSSLRPVLRREERRPAGDLLTPIRRRRSSSTRRMRARPSTRPSPSTSGPTVPGLRVLRPTIAPTRRGVRPRRHRARRSRDMVHRWEPGRESQRPRRPPDAPVTRGLRRTTTT